MQLSYPSVKESTSLRCICVSRSRELGEVQTALRGDQRAEGWDTDFTDDTDSVRV